MLDKNDPRASQLPSLLASQPSGGSLVAPSPNDPIDVDVLKRALGGSIFGTRLLYYDSVESTNGLAKSLALQGAPEGTLLLTNQQTAGRGRMGRSWVSPKGANLLFSVLLRPRLKTNEVFALTMIMAVSAAESLSRRTGIAARIKWPNDLYVGRRKLAGILTEIALKEKMLDYVVVGMGLNVHWHPRDDQEMRVQATSLLLETGLHCSRADLLVGILTEFELGYRHFLEGEREVFCRRWNDLSMVLGRNVVVESEPEIIQGKALRIDTSGALIVEVAGGLERKILCGDVSLRLE